MKHMEGVLQMKTYEKPCVTVHGELTEGVYAASGDYVPKCDSIYMNGVWQAPDNSDWAGGTRGYKQQFGCLGCPANTNTECGLNTHYEDADHAGSYDTDDGNRKPSWEKKGYGPDDVVADWSM